MLESSWRARTGTTHPPSPPTPFPPARQPRARKLRPDVGGIGDELLEFGVGCAPSHVLKGLVEFMRHAGYPSPAFFECLGRDDVLYELVRRDFHRLDLPFPELLGLFSTQLFQLLQIVRDLLLEVDQ